MKKLYFVNAIPLVLWHICFFISLMIHIFQYINIEVFDVLLKINPYVPLIVFFLTPIVLSVINCISTKKHKECVIANIVSSGANVIGYCLYGMLNYLVLDNEGATLAITVLFVIVQTYYTVYVSALGVLINFLINHKNKGYFYEKRI